MKSFLNYRLVSFKTKQLINDIIQKEGLELSKIVDGEWENMVRGLYYQNEDRNFCLKVLNGELVFRYTPKGKETVITDGGYWTRDNKYRQSTKIGKGLRKIYKAMGYNPPAKDIEIIVNGIKAEYNIDADIKEVSGEDIRHWYSVDNYASNQGTLTHSCMRYKSCQKYFDIYCNNPDKVKMIIAVNKANKLVGRAILWNTESHGLFADRIYGKDATIETIKNYCRKKGYYHKVKQSYDCSEIIKDGEVRDNEIYILLDNSNIDYYPYMDTLKHTDDIDCSAMVLSSTSGGTELTCTEGFNDDGYVTLACGDRCHEDDACYVENEGEYYHMDDCVYSEHYQEYILYNLATEVDGEWVLDDDDDIVECEDDREWHFTTNCVYSSYEDCWLYEYYDTCEIEGVVSSDNIETVEIGGCEYRFHRDYNVKDLMEHNVVSVEEYEVYLQEQGELEQI